MLAGSYISTNLFSLTFEGILGNWEFIENKVERIKGLVGK